MVAFSKHTPFSVQLLILQWKSRVYEYMHAITLTTQLEDLVLITIITLFTKSNYPSIRSC